jgi:2-succinyl-5-enolpyruvyl-6-hydroxy-3-cyclohexene-1-carboxylate synthase
LLALTADRPPELQDSGANQTIDQSALYGDALRWGRTLASPSGDDRTLRSLRTTAARALAQSTGTPPGPVHLNCPFRKPLEPAGSGPEDLPDFAALGAGDRDGPHVTTTAGTPTLDDATPVAEAVAAADRGLLVAGPSDDERVPDAVATLAAATGFPVLADPLSGLRFGSVPDAALVCGGYDGYLQSAVVDDWPDPDIVLRVGASPTSKRLRHYLRDAATRQLLVDPAGGWREATFTATDLVVADPARLATSLAASIDGPVVADGWRDRFRAAEDAYWSLLDDEGRPVEGEVLATAMEHAPDPATVVVGNSTPVRDCDRFVPPAAAGNTTLGNRGASGIDGVTSTALGAGSATDDDLVAVLGDLSFYHDTTGLLAIERCEVAATIVCINNDGGGIFHLLPIERFDPPFTEAFRTPHGIDFGPLGDVFAFEHVRTSPDAFADVYREALDTAGTHVVEVITDAAGHHSERERLDALVGERLS